MLPVTMRRSIYSYEENTSELSHFRFRAHISLDGTFLHNNNMWDRLHRDQFRICVAPCEAFLWKYLSFV